MIVTGCMEIGYLVNIMTHCGLCVVLQNFEIIFDAKPNIIVIQSTHTPAVDFDTDAGRPQLRNAD